MKKKRFLAAILLGVVLCFVVSGVGYGEIKEWMLEANPTYMEFSLLRATVGYIMRYP